MDGSVTFDTHLSSSESGRTAIKTVKAPPHQRVLLMDDDASIREVVGAMLRQLGYTAVVATDGEEAVSLFHQAKAQGQPFDLVLMDLAIPGRSGGKEAIEKLRNLDPTVKAVVSSGSPNDPIIKNFGAYGFSGVLSKPFSLRELSQKISEVLQTV